MGIIIPIIKAILWIKDNYIKRLREYHLEKAQQMVVTTCYCLIKCLTHLEILSGHLSVLILLYLSALFAIAGNFFLLETFFPLVSRTPRYLPHWLFRGLLFWLFLIFLILEHSRSVSLDLFSSLSILIPLVIPCSPVVLNNIHTLTTSQFLSSAQSSLLNFRLS